MGLVLNTSIPKNISLNRYVNELPKVNLLCIKPNTKVLEYIATASNMTPPNNYTANLLEPRIIYTAIRIAQSSIPVIEPVVIIVVAK